MLITADFQNYLDYFKAWAEAQQLFFLYGGVELGISYATSKEDFSYPFAWLEQPEIVSEDNGAGQLIEAYYGGISVICSAPLDDRAAQVQAEVDAMRLLQGLQKKMRLDNRNKGTLDCTISGMKKTAVDRGWAGSHWGWRLEFELRFTANGLLS